MKAATAVKLRKGGRYFASDHDGRFGKLIPLIHRYVGRHLCKETGKEMHLFLVEGNDYAGVYAEDNLEGVEEYSKERAHEIDVAAEYFNETNRVPSKKTMRRLLSQ